MIKAVIFDMDGLMFDTESLAIRTWQIAASQLGYQVPDDLFRACIGLDRRATKERVLERLGNGLNYEEAEALHHKLFTEHVEKFGVEKKPGLDCLLSFLRESKLKMAVATSTDRSSAEKMLKNAEVYSCFEGFVYGDMVQKGKPAPDIFLKAAELLGVLPRECVVLEDSHNGIKAAHSAGMKPVMVPDLLPVTGEIAPILYKSCETLGEVVPILREIM